MKKYLLMLFTMISMFIFSSGIVNADGYEGKVGYESTGGSYIFYYYTEQPDVTVTLNIYSSNGDANRAMAKENGVYVLAYNASVGDEYNYTICQAGGSPCETVVDPFSPYLNNAETANVILDVSLIESDWGVIETNPVNDYSRSIYALDPAEFVANLPNPVVDGKTTFSVFDKMIAPLNIANTAIGMEYIKTTGYTYIEMSHLYNNHYYFNINPNYSNKVNENDALKEYQAMIKAYKGYNLNVILRTTFSTASPELGKALNAISPGAVNEGKLNFLNPIVQRYIKEVYLRWVTEYKVDGFYIEDSIDYGSEYLASLISDIKEIKKDSFIYTGSDAGEFTASDKLQNLLLGSLERFDNAGILNGAYDQEKLTSLYQAMFSGYYGRNENLYNSVKTINNFGDLEELDVYSKIKGSLGMAANNTDVINKIKLALYTIYASAGTPRVVAGNEFLNTSMNDGVGVDDENKACITSSLCYLKGTEKSINWNSLKDNGNISRIMINYRNSYYYQYPSLYSMTYAGNIIVNEELLSKGVLFVTFMYRARNNGDIEKSILIINYSDEEITMGAISENDYTKVSALLGRVKDVEGNTSVAPITLYTYTQVKNVSLPQWVYIVVVLSLIGVVIGVRQLGIYLLKKKHGIDYNEIKPDSRWFFRKKKGEKEEKKPQEPSIFETFVASDPLIKERREMRKAEKEKKKAQKKEQKNNDDDNKKEGE
ncbi:MAG: hypothetical protein IKJ30_03150 [Bacilli bacterium]|nr:hypothetical protein [Bacilli bacterium]